MKAIDSKILVKKEDQKDSKLTERLGGFEVPAGAGEYETYRVISVGPKVEGVVEEISWLHMSIQVISSHLKETHSVLSQYQTS